MKKIDSWKRQKDIIVFYLKNKKVGVILIDDFMKDFIDKSKKWEWE